MPVTNLAVMSLASWSPVVILVKSWPVAPELLAAFFIFLTLSGSLTCAVRTRLAGGAASKKPGATTSWPEGEGRAWPG